MGNNRQFTRNMDEPNQYSYVPMMDDPPISGQKFVVLNIVGKHTMQKADQTYVKIKYVCETEEEAAQFARKKRDADDVFDNFVAMVGRFLPVDVDPSIFPDQQFASQHLTELIREHM